MKRYLPIIIIVVVLAGAVGTFVMLSKKGSGNSDTNTAFVPTNQPALVANASPPPAQSSPESVPPTKPNVKVSSPVVLEEYGDYQCPPCGALHPDLKKIESEYGNQVHFVFHYLPLTTIHKNAMTAARAAEAARLQNKFWEMHDRLYRNQKAWVDQEDPRPTFVSYARELGLNADQFQQDMDSNRVEQAIVADIRRAMSLGINGTPTIVIDGQQLRADATNPVGIRRGINFTLERKPTS
ncbi:MAG TPA: thioredoxin domain-containing protein [Pyrinomonadaceae bacterium]|nr:thioredoxin domain-containing protein [Pyrinomonadaceae bacterium]